MSQTSTTATTGQSYAPWLIDQLTTAAQTLAGSGHQPAPLSWPTPRIDDRALNWEFDPLEALIEGLQPQPLPVLEAVSQLPNLVQATTAAAVVWCRLGHPGTPPADLPGCPVCARTAPDYQSYPANPNTRPDH